MPVPRVSLLVGICASLFLGTIARAQSGSEQTEVSLLVKVIDENQLPVEGAHLILVHPGSGFVFSGETDFLGEYNLKNLAAGLYRLQVQKKGFYLLTRTELQVSEPRSIEITLNHQAEIAEVVDVVYSDPVVDPSEAASTDSLEALEILSLPYPTERDIRNVLSFLPGILQDHSQRLHLNGADSHEILSRLDGFDIGQPATGLLDLRFSPDALRRIEVLRSRYSAEFGKNSGGVLNFETRTGDDRYRFGATNFLPSVQFGEGIALETWTPRLNLSGPIRKGKAWLFEALQGEYSLNILDDLPRGENRSQNWRLNSFSKVQINFGSSNILTSSLLTNTFRSNYADLSRFNPIESTRDERINAYLFSIKDQAYRNGSLLEFGFALNRFSIDQQPQGDAPFQIFPGGARGNFYRETLQQSERLQWIANLTPPPVQWTGQHEFKIGTDLARIGLEELSKRRPIFIFNNDATLSRQTTFTGSPLEKRNWELGFFSQDRWMLSDRLLMELGLRLDWDTIIRQLLVSPRLAVSHLLSHQTPTKLVGGVGIFYDDTHLDFIARPAAGRRLDQFYPLEGETLQPSLVTTEFSVNETALEAPRSLNWSLGLERQLSAPAHLTIEFEQRLGAKGFSFVRQDNLANTTSRVFELKNLREDRYHMIRVDLDWSCGTDCRIFASYSRSSARSNAVMDFDIDNLIIAPPGKGPLAWDTPDRLLSWGWLPLAGKFRLLYSFDWRDGFPFHLLNANQELVGAPNSHRFPAYFSLNLHVEQKFQLLGRHWLMRIGFDNISGRNNATVVDNNIDSPTFLSFGAVRGRALVGRLRFLGHH